MDTEELFAVDPDDIPLLVATGVIGVGCILVITDIGYGHPLVAGMVIGGTVAFVGLTFRRMPKRDLRATIAAASMILGSVLVGIEFRIAFEFDGPVGAALFLSGAVGISKYVDD